MSASDPNRTLGNEQEAIAYYRKTFEIDAFGGSERQTQAFVARNAQPAF
jgi:hypothetical protein